MQMQVYKKIDKFTTILKYLSNCSLIGKNKINCFSV